MKKLFRHMLSLFILLAVSGFGVINHASAMPASMHQVEHDAAHSSHTQLASSSTRCATPYMNAIVCQEYEYLSPEENLDDDDPIVPFYVQQQSLIYDAKSLEQSVSVFAVRPPPKVPVYILYGVFRA